MARLQRTWFARVALLVAAFTLAAAASAQSKDAPELPSIPETVPDVSAHEGANVVAVRAVVEGKRWTTPPSLHAPKVGSPFALAVTRGELRRLLDGGGFATGSLEVNALAGGVEIVYRLVPARLVQRVVLKGNPLGDDEVRRAAGLADVRDVTEKSLAAATQQTRSYLGKRGFPAARVDVTALATDSPLGVVVQITIDAGAPVLVERRIFAGIPTFDADARAAGEAYAVAVGERADEEALADADRELANKLRGGGFPSALVSHAVAPGSGALTVSVIAGPRVVPHFEGSILFDRSKLLEILDLAHETDRSPLRLASKLEAAYRRHGYYDAFVEPELLGKPTDQQRTLRFRIREGNVVTIEKREYPCLSGALTRARINEEIDSFLEAELASDIFAPDVYERAREHLIELFRSEGYMFVEIGDVSIARGSCAKGSMPGPNGCKVVAPLPIDEKKLCRLDSNQLPLPTPPLDKKHSCVPDPLKGIECAPTVQVVLPINPGPRSYLWDVAVDDTHAMSPATLMGPKAAGKVLRMGAPLSLSDAEAACKAIVEYYRDEGYAFVSVRATFEYSGDRSRARVRFLVSEGEQVVIDKIFIEGEKKTLESLIRARLLITEGGVYRAGLVRESQDRLAKLGVFQTVSIDLVNPTIPAKRKAVVVSVRERPPHHIEGRIGYSTGEGLRGYVEYGYGNLFGYAVSLDFRARVSFQPFLGATCGPERGDPCSGNGIYDTTVVRRWVQETTKAHERVPRRIGVGLSFPHTPFLGGDVRTTIEFANVLDLRREFVGNKLLLPVVTMTYTPWRPLTMIFGGGIERNDFTIFDRDQQDLGKVLTKSPELASLLRVPEGKTGVYALSVSSLLDFRDSRLSATKNGYLSLSGEYVRSFDNAFDETTKQGVRAQFLHVLGAAGAYYQLKSLPKKPVLAFELRGGGNFNVLSCAGAANTKLGSVGAPEYCDPYPDRRFYLGGFDSTRGYYQGTMLPQDSIDALLNDKTIDRSNLGALAARGGNVFINPRAELRIPAFKWGGVVLFVDAANTWRESSRFQPFRLRYAVGPGVNIDTPIGPMAIDLGFNLSRYREFDEPLFVPYFNIGRF